MFFKMLGFFFFRDGNCLIENFLFKEGTVDTVPPGAVAASQLVSSSEVPVAFHLNPSWVNIPPTTGQSTPFQAVSLSPSINMNLWGPQTSYFPLWATVSLCPLHSFTLHCKPKALHMGRHTHSATEIHPSLCVSILTGLLLKHALLMLVGALCPLTSVGRAKFC